MIKTSESILILLVAALFMIQINGCSGSEDDSLSLESVKWKAESLNGTKLTLGKDITIAFDKKTSRVSGFAGCNTFLGIYARNTVKLAFGELASTDMYCDKMQTETEFLAALGSVEKFKISGSKLTLISKEVPVIVFRKLED